MSEVKVFIHQALEEERKVNSFLQSLIEDFKAYKKGDFIPYFGRDAQYMTPNTVRDANILHIHILHQSSKAFQRQQAAIGRGNPLEQFGLRCDMDRPEFDRALVYTTGYYNENYYYILDFFSKNAHELASSNSVMNELVKRAINFRNKF